MSRAVHAGVGPAHRMVLVRMHAIGGADEHGPEADGESDVAPPVDTAAMALAVVAQFAVGPERAEDADRHVDPEDGPPVDGSEDASGGQPDELPGEGGDLIDAQCQAALLKRKGVGQDGRRIGREHRPADGLQDAPSDEPQRPVAALERVEREQDRRDREDHEAGVVDLHPAVHVAEAAQRDHENRLNEAVSHDHPEQVADVSSGQRIEVDPTEDGRQRDDDDRAVERRHEDGGRRIGQRRPFVAVVHRCGYCHQMLSARRSSRGAAAISCLSSARVKPPASASASWLVRASLRLRRTWRPALLSESRARRPSPGSARRSMRPRFSRAASVAPIDCGLMRSSLARSLDVSGPFFSSRASATLSGMVRPPSGGVWRSRRSSTPMLSRSASATWRTSGS